MTPLESKYSPLLPGRSVWRLLMKMRIFNFSLKFSDTAFHLQIPDVHPVNDSEVNPRTGSESLKLFEHKVY